jgi:hypothetical protein
MRNQATARIVERAFLAALLLATVAGADAAHAEQGRLRRWGTTNFPLPPDIVTARVLTMAGTAAAVLRDDGSVQAWGSYSCSDGVLEVPPGLGRCVQVVASNRGLEWSCVTCLRETGDLRTIVGSNIQDGNLPEFITNELNSRITTNGAIVSLGRSLAVAYANGNLACNLSVFGAIVIDLPPPPGAPVTVFHACPESGAAVALKSDGSLVAWTLWHKGGKEPDPSFIPGDLLSVQAFDASPSGFLFLRSDGGVRPYGGFSPVPPDLGPCVAVAAGDNGVGIVLTANGKVRSWGYGLTGDAQQQCEPDASEFCCAPLPADLGRVTLIGIGGRECDSCGIAPRIAFESSQPDPCDSDLNGDGAIDGLDLGIVLGTWGTCTP